MSLGKGPRIEQLLGPGILSALTSPRLIGSCIMIHINNWGVQKLPSLDKETYDSHFEVFVIRLVLLLC